MRDAISRARATAGPPTAASTPPRRQNSEVAGAPVARLRRRSTSKGREPVCHPGCDYLLCTFYARCVRGSPMASGTPPRAPE
jgi:hypothetical protein